VAGGLQVWPRVMEKHLQEELPFLAMEAVIMAGVRAGGDRQTLHEAVRRHAMEAARRMKEEGVPSDLLDRLRADPLFAAIHDNLDDLLDPARHIGRAPQQVETFLREHVDPVLARYAEKGGVEPVEV